MALKHTSIDAASFTTIRLLSGACMLWWVVRLKSGPASTATAGSGNWLSAGALFVYAAAFSFAYVSMSAATGALLLFGAVQATMILTGLWLGERLNARQVGGLLLALAGVAAILSPSLDAPPLGNALLMLASGAAWGVYSLRGRGVADPTGETAGNFLRAALLSVLLSGALLAQQQLDALGLLYALLSGAVTSGLGYAIWYAVVPRLSRTRAATVQLSVPVLAALAGVLLVQEPITLRLLLTSSAVLGGIALVVLNKHAAV
jgi:drug/metabolite transporter (DMT)-like permease